MNLVFQRDDPFNTTIAQSSITPLYRIKTKERHGSLNKGDTLIYKIYHNRPQIMGAIRRHGFDKDQLIIGDRPLKLSSHQLFNRYDAFSFDVVNKFKYGLSILSWGTFEASDGREYKWKVDRNLKQLHVRSQLLV